MTSQIFLLFIAFTRWLYETRLSALQADAFSSMANISRMWVAVRPCGLIHLCNVFTKLLWFTCFLSTALPRKTKKTQTQKLASSKKAFIFLVYRPSRWYPLCLVSPLAPNHTWKLQNIPSAGMSKPHFDHSRVWTLRWYSSAAFMGVWVDLKISSMSWSLCVEVKYTLVPQSVSLQVKREETVFLRPKYDSGHQVLQHLNKMIKEVNWLSIWGLIVRRCFGHTLQTAETKSFSFVWSVNK